MLLSVAEAAAKRGVTRFSIHRWIKSGLRHGRIGRQLVIDAGDLAAFTPRAVGNPNPANNGGGRSRHPRR